MSNTFFQEGRKFFLGGFTPPGYGPGLQDLSNHGKSREQNNSIIKNFGGVIAVDTVGNTNQKNNFQRSYTKLDGLEMIVYMTESLMDSIWWFVDNYLRFVIFSMLLINESIVLLELLICEKAIDIRVSPTSSVDQYLTLIQKSVL